jgi:hypothetical protein
MKTDPNYVATEPTNTAMAFRLVEIKDGVPHTLFHGLPQQNQNGRIIRSRRLPIGVWLKAEQKPVTDGDSSTVYQSGFNVLLEITSMLAYAKRFKAPRTLCIARVIVDVDSLRPKSHSHAGVQLAGWMKLCNDWKVGKATEIG